MGNKFYAEGNLGQDPVLNYTGEDDDSAVCNLRVYFDKPVPVKNGFEDKGGFWMDVEHWGERGIACSKLLKSGHRVIVDGAIISKEWENNGEPQSKLVVRAKRVSPDIMVVESLKAKKQKQGD